MATKEKTMMPYGGTWGGGTFPSVEERRGWKPPSSIDRKKADELRKWLDMLEAEKKREMARKEMEKKLRELVKPEKSSTSSTITVGRELQFMQDMVVSQDKARNEMEFLLYAMMDREVWPDDGDQLVNVDWPDGSVRTYRVNVDRLREKVSIIERVDR